MIHGFDVLEKMERVPVDDKNRYEKIDSEISHIDHFVSSRLKELRFMQILLQMGCCNYLTKLAPFLMNMIGCYLSWLLLAGAKNKIEHGLFRVSTTRICVEYTTTFSCETCAIIYQPQPSNRTFHICYKNTVPNRKEFPSRFTM